jgi:hypothetical protein
MNWLERARREIVGCAHQGTANTAERSATAVLAVGEPEVFDGLELSNGSNGGTPPARMQEAEAMREAFEERAAIIEFDGGLGRDEAERAALAIVQKQRHLH